MCKKSSGCINMLVVGNEIDEDGIKKLQGKNCRVYLRTMLKANLKSLITLNGGTTNTRMTREDLVTVAYNLLSGLDRSRVSRHKGSSSSTAVATASSSGNAKGQSGVRRPAEKSSASSRKQKDEAGPSSLGTRSKKEKSFPIRPCGYCKVGPASHVFSLCGAVGICFACKQELLMENAIPGAKLENLTTDCIDCDMPHYGHQIRAIKYL